MITKVGMMDENVKEEMERERREMRRNAVQVCRGVPELYVRRVVHL